MHSQFDEDAGTELRPTTGGAPDERKYTGG